MISKVTEGIYRGPRLDDLTPLKELGIKTILNLENDNEAVLKERDEVLHFKFNQVRWPMSEIRRPYSSELRWLVENINNGAYDLPIYIHCLHGQDRTGYVIAAYRMLVQGWTYKKAYQEAKDMGHKWWFAPYLLFWPKSLKELR